MATEDDKVNTGALGTLIAVGLFATLSIALSVTALVRYSVQGVVDQRQSLLQQGYHQLRDDQTGKLSGNPAWTDKVRGLVSIPIERAKLKVLADLARDPASASPPAPASAAPAPEAAPPGSAAPAPTTASLEKAPAPARTVAAVKPAAPTAPAPAPVPAPKPTDG